MIIDEKRLDMYLESYKEANKIIQINIIGDLARVYPYDFINDIFTKEGYTGLKYLYYAHYILEKCDKTVLN